MAINKRDVAILKNIAIVFKIPNFEILIPNYFVRQLPKVYSVEVAGAHHQQVAAGPAAFGEVLAQKGGVGEDVDFVVLESGTHLFGVQRRQFFVCHGMRVEINYRHVGKVHAASVLCKEFGRKAAESVQLHAGHQPAVWVLLFHGGNGGAQFRRSVGKVFIHSGLRVFFDQFQTFRGAFESAYRR